VIADFLSLQCCFSSAVYTFLSTLLVNIIVDSNVVLVVSLLFLLEGVLVSSNICQQYDTTLPDEPFFVRLCR